MHLPLLNVLLAFGWALVTGGFSLLNLVLGFLVGMAALWMSKPLYGPTRYFRRVGQTIYLIAFFVKELIVSSLRVAWDVVTPEMKSRPGVVAIPLDAETDNEIMVTANLISLTPGTLSLDVSPDRKYLYVHAMFIEGPDSVRAEIKQGLERRVLEAMR